MKTEGHRMRLVVPSHVASTTEASKCRPVTSSTATRPSSALIMWQEGLWSDSVTGKQIWVMLRAELLQTGNIHLLQVQILPYSIGKQPHQKGNYKHDE